MKRSPFKVQRPPGSRPPRAAKQIGEGYTIRPRAIAVAVAGPARATVRVPKAAMLQHEGYMAAVRSLPCYRCHKPPRSQFCHADEGKGTGIKSDCRLGWPGCGNCHFYIGTVRALGKADRRKWEAEAGRATRATIRDLGLWPASLPAWPDDEVPA